MKALWLEDNTLSYREDVPGPAPRGGEALIRVRLAGVCGTDLELVKGYYPFSGIPGHEFVGEIIEAPDCPERVGERVVGEINVTCGSCLQCVSGRPSHCESRSVLGIVDRNGAFAEYLRLPAANLFTVPDTVEDEAAVFTEPLAAALRIQEQMAILPTDRVLVLGAGRLGQLVAQTLLLTGCDLQVVARYEKQRALLAGCGIPWLDEEAVKERFFDVTVEATGSPGGFHLARKAIRPGGRMVMKSTYRGDLSLDFASLVVDEINIMGSRCGPFGPALRLLEKGLVDPAVLIEDRYTLDDGIEAFERAAEPGRMKVLIQVVKK